MRDNKLKPSKELIEEYRQSKTTKTLNRFPSKEELKEKIDMWDERYDKLKKAYSSRPEFIYYFDPHLDIQTKIGKYLQLPCISIGYFEEGKVKLINNYTLHFKFLLIITFFLILLLISMTLKFTITYYLI